MQMEQDSPYIKDVEELQQLAMAHAERNVELEEIMNEMKQAEYGYLSRIAQLEGQRGECQQEPLPHVKEIEELQELALGYAKRNTELEAVIQTMEQTEHDQLMLITQLQQAGNFTEEEPGKDKRVAEQVKEVIVAQVQRNHELEALITELRQVEQQHLTEIARLQQQLRANEEETSRSCDFAEALEVTRNEELQAYMMMERLQDAAGHAEQQESMISEMKQTEQDFKLQIVELQDALTKNGAKASAEIKEFEITAVDAMRDTERNHELQILQLRTEIDHVESTASACGQRNVQLEEQLEGMRRALYERDSQMALLEQAVAENSNRGKQNVEFEEERNQLIQTICERDLRIAQLEQVIVGLQICGQRNDNPEAKSNGLNHTMNEPDSWIVKLEQVVSGTDDHKHISRLAELETAVAAQLQRNAQLEASIRSMQEQKAQMADVAVAPHMQNATEGRILYPKHATNVVTRQSPDAMQVETNRQLESNMRPATVQATRGFSSIPCVQNVTNFPYSTGATSNDALDCSIHHKVDNGSPMSPMRGGATPLGTTFSPTLAGPIRGTLGAMKNTTPHTPALRSMTPKRMPEQFHAGSPQQVPVQVQAKILSSSGLESDVQGTSEQFHARSPQQVPMPVQAKILSVTTSSGQESDLHGASSPLAPIGPTVQRASIVPITLESQRRLPSSRIQTAAPITKPTQYSPRSTSIGRPSVRRTINGSIFSPTVV